MNDLSGGKSNSAEELEQPSSAEEECSRLTPQYIIAKKRQNDFPLTSTEVSWFIRQFMAGEVKDYQMAAFLMAICLNGMSDEETAALTEAMVQSGDVMDWSCHGLTLPHKVDKHSTGGVGDKVSLVVAPLVASFGLIVPMMAGRGLGHTGGTIDKLESIPGFRSQYSTTEFADLLLSQTIGERNDTNTSDDGNRKRRKFSDNSSLNVAIVSPSNNICPADKKMYALRDVTATVTSLPLQTSSIMSKKIAERPDSLVLDVKFGKGSFNKHSAESIELAQKMIQTGELCGIRTSALVTRMDDPLGYAVGNWLEVRECISIMTSNGKFDDLSKDLVDLILALAGQMLVQAGKIPTLKEGIVLSREHLANGKAWKKFQQMVVAQGGDISYLINPEKCFLPKFSEKVVSSHKGYISSVNSMEIGLVGVLLGAGRKTITDDVDFTSGILFHQRPGMFVEEGDVLATVYTEREPVLKSAVSRVQKAFRFSREKVKMPPLIAHFLTNSGVQDFDQSVLTP